MLKNISNSMFSSISNNYLKSKRLLSLCLILFVLIPYSVAEAQIIETSDITQITTEIDQNTLVLLDIDNTLVQLPQTLGTPEWFADFYKKKRDQGMVHEQSMKETLDIYLRVNKQSQALPVDKRTFVVIQKLQQQGILVLGLTSRDDALYNTTIQHLRSVKINFNIGQFKNYHLKLKTGEKSKVQNGIIFTGGEHKGECLQEFLSTVNWIPKKIIFVDDQLKAVQEVEGSIKSNIPFIGFRYGYLDTKVKNLNAKIPEVQLEKFNKTGILLSDKEALSILKSRKTIH